MKDKVFLDTNILVYARDISEPEKREKALEVIKNLWSEKRCCISTQVCNEYYVTVTRKLSHPLSEDEAWDDLNYFKALEPVALNMSCLELSRQIQLKNKISWWDSLIISAALMGGCHEIYTENLNHGQLYSGVRVINPFL